MSPSARAVALEVVRRVADEGAYSNRLLPAALARSGLDQRDRALATELAYGTLRHVPELDAAIGARAARPIARMSPGARAALRIGAYQLLHMRIPAHAAVGETVGVVVPRERGFVNAILRRLAKEPPEPARRCRRSGGQPPHRLGPVGREGAGEAPRPRGGRAGRARLGRARPARPPGEHLPGHRRPGDRRPAGRGARARDRLRPSGVRAASGRGPHVAPRMGGGLVLGAGSGVGVRRRDACPGAGRPGARRLRGTGGEDRLHRMPDRREGPGRRRRSPPGSLEADPRGPRAPRAPRLRPRAGRHQTRRPWSLRPGARGRAVFGDRLCAPPAGAALAAPTRGALPSRPAPGRDRDRRRRPGCAPAAAWSIRCARSRERRPTRRATRYSGIDPTCSPSKHRARKAPIRPSGIVSGRIATGPTGCSWRRSRSPADRGIGVHGYNPPPWGSWRHPSSRRTSRIWPTRSS